MKRFVLLFVVAIFSAYAFAQTTVNPGDGSLTAAIQGASNGDVLQLIPGATYTESNAYKFGAAIIHKNITIEVPGDANVQKAVLQITKAPDSNNNTLFFDLGDSASITLKNLEIDGSLNNSPSADYLIHFNMGDIAAPMTVHNIKILNCYIHDLNKDVINAGSSDMSGNVVVDSTWIDNCVVHNTGTSVYFKYCGANYVSITNSTFNLITSYGVRIGGPGYTNLPDNTPAVTIDHTTWYDIGEGDGREILLLEKGPNHNPWLVTNSIFVKQVNKSKTVINLKEMTDTTLATITNIDMWDVGARSWRGHTVKDTMNADPQFADAANGDFTLPKGSPLLTFGTDGGAIGDLRWATNATAVNENPTMAPSTFSLKQNYPNPFNPSTSISFSLKKAGMTSLVVYNMIGQKVATLVNRNLTSGEHTVSFYADNLPSGVYIYKLNAGSQMLSRKMVLLK